MTRVLTRRSTEIHVAVTIFRTRCGLTFVRIAPAGASVTCPRCAKENGR